MNAKTFAAAHQTEKALESQVRTLAGLRGWLVYHTYRSTHSPAGFPDLVLVRAPRVLFCELKIERGKLAPLQEVWLTELGDCPGIEVYLWRPSDWEEIERVLA